MPVKYLDPTLDIVFKLLLVSTPELLRDMIEAVLNPPTPIESVEVLNPEIPKDFPNDKGIALDLRVRLQNGHQIDLEMQSTVPDGIHARELPHLGLASADPRAKLERWARFLAAQTPEELEALANEDPMMNTARNALEKLSSDPEAQRLAEDRETGLLMHQHYMASAFEAGEVKGEAKTELKERRETVRLLCRVLGISLDEAMSERLSVLDAAGLSNLIGRLETERRWPEEFPAPQVSVP